MHPVFLLKLLLAHGALFASLFLIFGKVPFLRGKTPSWAIVAYYGLRLGILAVFFLGFKFSYPSENMGMYYYYADIVQHGAIPNRDFYMVYGILFPYLLAGATWIWHHPFALVALFQLTEFAAIYSIFTQKNSSLSLGAFLGYALNPVVLVWMWLGLQNQAMCLIPVAAVFALRNETQRSLVFAFGFAISKIFALWTILPALLGQRWKSRIIFLSALMVIYVPFVVAGASALSFKATEAGGNITEAANHPGVESLVALIPLNTMETKATHLILMGTAALLLVTLVGAFLLRFRLDREELGEDGRFQRELVFTAVFAVLLTLIYQAFATYTTPDYLTVAIVFAPVLAMAKFWTRGDQVLFVLVCYFQAMIYLLWFHLTEFGVVHQSDNGIFLTLLLLGNFFTIVCCLRCGFRAFTFFIRAKA